MDFLASDPVRGLRLQMDYLKPEILLRANNVVRTIVVFGSSRICEPKEARRRVEALRAAGPAAGDDRDFARRLAVAERVLANSRYYDIARDFGRIVAEANAREGDGQTLIMTGGVRASWKPPIAARSTSEQDDRPQHQLAARAVPEPLCLARALLLLPLFRAAQAPLFAAGHGAGRVSWRLRHARRNVRDPDPRSDAQDRADADRAGRRAPLAQRRRFRLPCRRRRDRSRGPGAVLVRRDRGRDLGRHPEMGTREGRALRREA